MDSFSFQVDALPPAPLDDGLTVSGLGVGGTFHAQCFRPDGSLRWEDWAKNIIPNAALNDILNVYFGATSQTTTFYMGMVDNAAFTAFAATDTMSSHTGWVESTATSTSPRPTWTPGAPSGQSISNGTAVQFAINATCTIKGFFLSSNNTLGGPTGNLVAEAALGSPQACANGDTLKVTYSINATTT